MVSDNDGRRVTVAVDVAAVFSCAPVVLWR
jgi:hypothetical protein